MLGTNGKGSRQRATQVGQKEADDNWDKIFNTKKKPTAGSLSKGVLFSITEGGLLYEFSHVAENFAHASLDDDPRMVARFALNTEVFLDDDIN